MRWDEGFGFAGEHLIPRHLRSPCGGALKEKCLHTGASQGKGCRKEARGSRGRRGPGGRGSPATPRTERPKSSALRGLRVHETEETVLIADGKKVPFVS